MLMKVNFLTFTGSMCLCVRNGRLVKNSVMTVYACPSVCFFVCVCMCVCVELCATVKQ